MRLKLDKEFGSHTFLFFGFDFTTFRNHPNWTTVKWQSPKAVAIADLQ